MLVRNSHRPAAPAWREPSWGRVLATTVGLWVQRRRTVRRWQVAAVGTALAIVAASLQVTGVFSGAPLAAAQEHPAASPLERAVPAAQSEAAAWIAGQVSNAAMVGCDPAMCAVLQARGVAAGRLLPVRPGATKPPNSTVVVISPSADGRSADRYAPALIASFGSGPDRTEVRVIEPGRAAAYAGALRSDLAARQAAGAQLIKNWHIQFGPRAAAQIRAGQVDARLLATLAALAARYRFRVTAFSDAAPGVPGSQLPFRQVTISAGRNADLAGALAMVRVQNPPYLPAHAGITGRTVLSIEFAAPSPLGLLTPVLMVSPHPGHPAGAQLG